MDFLARLGGGPAFLAVFLFRRLILCFLAIFDDASVCDVDWVFGGFFDEPEGQVVLLQDPPQSVSLLVL